MSNLSRYVGLLLLTLFVCFGSVASGCGDEDGTGSSTQFGAISGAVTLQGRDDASGVQIEASGVTAQTDAEGTFRLDQVPLGEHVVKASLDGYTPQQKSVEVVADGVEVDFALELAATVPLISQLVVEPDVVLPSETVAARVELSSEHTGELIYTWEATGGFEVTPGEDRASAEVTAPSDFDQEGSVRVVVENIAGESASAEATVRTRQNRAPVIENLAALPSVVTRGGTATLSVAAFDPDGDELMYAWDLPSGWTASPQDGAQVTVTAPDVPDQTATIGVTVRDGLGGEATGEVDVSTASNTPPQITSLTAAPTQTTPGGEIALAVVGRDADADALGYAWSAPTGWTFDDPTVASPTLTAPELYDEVARLSVEVSDAHGATTTGEIVVSTISNQGPQLTTVTASPTVVARGGTIALHARASHPHGEPLTYQWQAPSDWTLVTSGNPDEQPELQAPDAPGASAVVEVTVTDPTGRRAVGSVVVQTEANRAPVVSSMTVTPRSVRPGQTAMVEAAVNDPDGDTLTYTWTVPQGWSGTSTTETLDLTAPDAYDQSANVLLEVSDGYATVQSLVSVSTVANFAPVVTNLTATPQLLDRGATSSLRVFANDPNGDALTYTWIVDNAEWTVNGSGDQVTLASPAKPDSQVTVTVIVDDGNGASTSSDVSLSTVGNQTPTIASLTHSPAGWVARAGTVSVTVDATDPEGDTLSYAWSATSGWSINGSGATVDVSAPDASATSGTITVTVTDAFGATVDTQLDLITQDTEPDAFGFQDQTDVAPSTPITSNQVAVTGFEGQLSAVCTGCEVSRNGGTFATTVAGFESGDLIEVRQTSGAAGQTESATVTLGDTTSDAWQVSSATVMFELFTNSGTFTVPGGVTSVRVLVVGGGGGGANGHQGGGGSGYVRVAQIATTPGDAIAVTVGAGGTGADECSGCNTIVGNTPGESSSFGGFLSANGGGTATTTNGPAGSGGSGGGGSCNAGSPGGDGGSAGSGGVSCTHAAGSGQGDFTSDLASFTDKTITAGAGGAGGTSSHSAGGGAGGVVIDGAGPAGSDGPRSWSGKGGEGYGAGGGAGGYDSATSPMRERGGDGAAGVVYIEW